MAHLSAIVVFRLGKNRGEFSRWRLACTPVSFYNSEKGPRPSDRGHRGLWQHILESSCWEYKHDDSTSKLTLEVIFVAMVT